MGAFVCTSTAATVEEEDEHHTEVESEADGEVFGVQNGEDTGESHSYKQEEESEHVNIPKPNPMEMRMKEKVPILVENDFRRLFGVSSLIQYGHFIHHYMSHIIYQYSDFINYMKTGSILMRGLDKFCAIVISDDGRYLFASTDDGSVITFDLDYHEIMHETKAHRSAIWTMVYRNGLLVTGGVDCETHIWDASTMQRIRSLPTQRDPVFQVHLNDSGDQLVSLPHFLLHADRVTTEHFTASAPVLSESSDTTMILWNTKTREIIQFFDGAIHIRDRLSYPLMKEVGNNNGDVCFHPRIPHLVAVSYSNAVSIRDARTGESLRIFEGHFALVSALCFTPDGSRLVSASHDRTVRIWDTCDLV